MATAPLSEVDAAKRVFDASKPLKATGIPVLDALRVVAGHLREIVGAPTVKGDVSRRLTAMLAEPYLRFCRSCDATHVYEMPFRLAAPQAGLEQAPEALGRRRDLVFGHDGDEHGQAGTVVEQQPALVEPWGPNPETPETPVQPVAPASMKRSRTAGTWSPSMTTSILAMGARPSPAHRTSSDALV